MTAIATTGHLSAITAAAANSSTVMNERIRIIRRTRFDTSSRDGRSTASQHSAR